MEKALTAILKYIKWKDEFGVDEIDAGHPDIQSQLETGKVQITNFNDKAGR